MARKVRVKDENATYHIISRSISEVDLFKDNADKEKYMEIVKHYKKIYNFKVYAYCLMSNHFHLIIDSNGSDISKIMHCINFKYAQYFNKRHGRHGHLFQDRFKSIIIYNNKYLLILSAYIHNNPTAIYGFIDNPEKYYYSSLSVYMGIKKDPFEILNIDFILSLFSNNLQAARKNYIETVMRSKYEEINNITNSDVEFENCKTEYNSYKKLLVKDVNEEIIIDYVAKKLYIDKNLLYFKNVKKSRDARALIVLLLRKLCNSSCKDICSILGNISQSCVSRLTDLGVKLIDDEKYNNIVNDFINEFHI